MEYTSKLSVVSNEEGFIEIWDEGEFWRFKQKTLLPSESHVLREYFVNEYKSVSQNSIQAKLGEFWIVYFKDFSEPEIGMVVNDGSRRCLETSDSLWDLDSRHIDKALLIDKGKELGFDALPGDVWFIQIKDQASSFVPVRIHNLCHNRIECTIVGSPFVSTVPFCEIGRAYRVDPDMQELV